MTAGPSFEVFYRSGYMLPHTDAAWVLLHERLVEAAAFLGSTVAAHPHLQPLAAVVQALADLAARLAAQKAGLERRAVKVPPAWGLGAVGPDVGEPPVD